MYHSTLDITLNGPSDTNFPIEVSSTLSEKVYIKKGISTFFPNAK